MDHVEELQQEISDLGIYYDEQAIGNGCSGLYFRSSDDAIIIVDSALEGPQKRCVAAEELGHHHTSAGDLRGVCAYEYERQEYRARKWAVKRILRLDDICAAYVDNDGAVFSMADQLDVTPEFLDGAIKVYCNKYGVSHRTARYSVRFIPYFQAIPIKKRR